MFTKLKPKPSLSSSPSWFSICTSDLSSTLPFFLNQTCRMRLYNDILSHKYSNLYWHRIFPLYEFLHLEFILSLYTLLRPLFLSVSSLSYVLESCSWQVDKMHLLYQLDTGHYVLIINFRGRRVVIRISFCLTSEALSLSWPYLRPWIPSFCILRFLFWIVLSRYWPFYTHLGRVLCHFRKLPYNDPALQVVL